MEKDKKATPAKKAKRAKIPKIKKREEAVIDCIYKFNDAEKLELSRELTSKMTTLHEVEEQKKTVTSEYAGKIKVIAAEIGVIHNKLTAGYETRPTKVIVHFNEATDLKGKKIEKPGMKRIVRADSGDHVRDEPMSPADMHAELFEKRKLEEESQKAKQKSNGEQPSPPQGEMPLNAPVVPEEGKASTAATA